MSDTRLSTGEIRIIQSFYFPNGHHRAGVFKGMAIILEDSEAGFVNQVQAGHGLINGRETYMKIS